MAATFVHLHLHTEFSLVDSTVRIPQLMQRCRDDAMPAVAMTDQNNLFAMVKFYKQATAAGIKPIVGADIRVANEDDNGRPHTMILLCQNDAERTSRAGNAALRSYTEHGCNLILAQA